MPHRRRRARLQKLLIAIIANIDLLVRLPEATTQHQIFAMGARLVKRLLAFAAPLLRRAVGREAGQSRRLDPKRAPPHVARQRDDRSPSFRLRIAWVDAFRTRREQSEASEPRPFGACCSIGVTRKRRRQCGKLCVK
jgi:hypothetical protein